MKRTILPSKLNNHEQVQTVGGRKSSARNFYELEIEYQFSLLQGWDDSPEDRIKIIAKIKRSQKRAQALDEAFNSPDSTWASIEVFCKAWSKRWADHPAYQNWYRLFYFY